MSIKKATPEADPHQWAFKPSFKLRAFGWKSQPAITRIKQAVAEIKKVAKKEPAVAGEGAVILLERVSPAIENVDSSSGSIGTAVNHAVAELVAIIAQAPVDSKTRADWLERLFAAYQADQVPYLESLGERWGEVCVAKEIASAWAERFLPVTRKFFASDQIELGLFKFTSVCLSALFTAQRYDELEALVSGQTFWPFRRWAVLAIAKAGRVDDALRCAALEAETYSAAEDHDRVCEQILLQAGRTEEAYSQHGLRANFKSTYLATFRAVCQKYPGKSASEVLRDLVLKSPGDEGKWFAAAKEAGLYAEALALAQSTPCDPLTLSRAARDYADEKPEFAMEVGLLSLRGIIQGYGYEITPSDIYYAFTYTMKAADELGQRAQATERVNHLLTADGLRVRDVADTLRRELRK